MEKEEKIPQMLVFAPQSDKVGTHLWTETKKLQLNAWMIHICPSYRYFVIFIFDTLFLDFEQILNHVSHGHIMKQTRK